MGWLAVWWVAGQDSGLAGGMVGWRAEWLAGGMVGGQDSGLAALVSVVQRSGPHCLLCYYEAPVHWVI